MKENENKEVTKGNNMKIKKIIIICENCGKPVEIKAKDFREAERKAMETICLKGKEVGTVRKYRPIKKKRRCNMTFKEYQKKAKTTLVKNNNSQALLIARLALGLAGEAGEVAEKVKKYLRDTHMSMLAKYRLAEDLYKELGDCLWYVANLAGVLSMRLDNVAKENIRKLASRKKRNKIKGSGDER